MWKVMSILGRKPSSLRFSRDQLERTHYCWCPSLGYQVLGDQVQDRVRSEGSVKNEGPLWIVHSSSYLDIRDAWGLHTFELQYYSPITTIWAVLILRLNCILLYMFRKHSRNSLQKKRWSNQYECRRKKGDPEVYVKRWTLAGENVDGGSALAGTNVTPHRRKWDSWSRWAQKGARATNRRLYHIPDIIMRLGSMLLNDNMPVMVGVSLSKTEGLPQE